MNRIALKVVSHLFYRRDCLSLFTPGRCVLPKVSQLECFTLIELLVVIAIIAVLVAVLLPALNVAREKGREVTCLNQMRQLGVSIQAYVDDYNGWLVGLYRKDYRYQGGKSDWWMWSMVLLRYADWFTYQLPSVWLCPTNMRWAGYPTPQTLSYARVSNSRYHYPSWNNWKGTWESTSGFFPIARIPNPSQQIILGEGEYNADHNHPLSFCTFVNYGGLTYYGAFHHTDRMGCLFADGHVAAMHPGSITAAMMDDPIP